MQKSLFTTVKHLFTETFKSANNHDVALYGAAIAFYTIFSVAPLIVIILGLTTVFLGEQQSAAVFSEYLTQLTGAQIADSLLEFANVSQRESSGRIASIIATAMLIFGATTVITQLKNALNKIWGITNPKISSVVLYIFNRFLALITILVLAALFIASLLLEGGMTFFTGLFLPYLPNVFTPFLKLASSLLSILITIFFFTLTFKLLPDVHARWRDIFVGACITTVLFLIGKYLVGFYLASGSLQLTYKAAGSLVVFLIWIYYNIQIVLIGAEFTQVYTKRFGKDLRASRNAEFMSS